MVVAVSAWLKPFGPVTVTAAPVPAGRPLMVTVSAPVVAVQATAKVVVAVSPAATATVRGLAPPIAQLAAAPWSRTAWLPAASPATLAVPFTPMGWALAWSMVNAYPSGSGSCPVVAVVIAIEPVEGGSAVQAMANATGATAPGETVTARGLSPSREQLAARPLSPTVCGPSAMPGIETVALVPID